MTIVQFCQDALTSILYLEYGFLYSNSANVMWILVKWPGQARWLNCRILKPTTFGSFFLMIKVTLGYLNNYYILDVVKDHGMFTDATDPQSIRSFHTPKCYVIRQRTICTKMII